MTDPLDTGVGQPADDAGDATPVDWDDLNKRLRRLRSNSGTSGGSVSAAARKKVLRGRAVALAQAREHDEAESDLLELLEFSLGSERYAIDSSAVKEVYALKEITPVPGTPAYILGVVAVRGRIVSVVDLGRLFGSPPRDAAMFTKAIVLKSASMEFAVLADEVSGMCRIPVADLQASLPTLTGTRKKYLRGVTSERVAVLDAQMVLGDDALVVRHERGAAR
jgi:purine-binding chemotaxis protein CheW